ncbi:glycoside hydrolase family 3 N-terminal domain-containing protein [Microbacterium sp.]|uniref:glycoside hydrolase family 3 N-terminal domain-containing protein n=1 Tax=Microbacterium sp. TaxID=51671 RepID=UPI003A8881C0
MTTSEQADAVVGGYRDLNGNGVMDPYENPALPVADRVADLVPRLSLEEKAGLMFHPVTAVSADGAIDGAPLRDNRPPTREFVQDRYVNHLNVQVVPGPRQLARWVNEVQRAALETPHGIPVTVATDPRHGFTENWGASFHDESFSAWPEPLGFGALAEPESVREFAEIARREYVAVGIRSALHPTLDVATEPRWARQYSTFGQSADTVADLGIAYVDGFEGVAGLSATGVACMAKHFPGGGPQRDGEDPHFPYGREQVYPAGMFEHHLEPFRRLIDRGVSAIMPSYGIPIGLTLDGEPVEEVGFGFNRQVITGLLREKLGFDGVVCTDWGLVTASRIGDKTLPARAWGVEHLSDSERVKKIIDAGCDQLGGEDDPRLVVELVRSGQVPESRIDESARRLLTVKFELGLFDDPFVDEEAAPASVGTADDRAAGRRAQARSMVVISTGRSPAVPLLPLPKNSRVFSEEVAASAIEAAGFTPVTTPAEADVAVARMQAPYDPRDDYMLESAFRAGSLDFSAEAVDRVNALERQVPVVAVVRLDRPAVLGPLLMHAEASVVEFGASDAAVLDVLSGQVPPVGVLPFDIPRSVSAVARARPDAPGDTERPLLRQGWPGARMKRRASRGSYRQGRESREVILGTALDVIERKGYSATSLRDIASEAGMTQAGLLHHFGTKENLLLEVLRQRDMLNRRLISADPGREPSTVLLARHNTQTPALVDLYVSLQAAASDPDHPAHEFFRRRDAEVHGAVARDIAARQAAGTVRAGIDADHMARVLVAVSDGLQAEWGIDRDIDMADTIERLWAVLLADPGSPSQGDDSGGAARS